MKKVKILGFCVFSVVFELLKAVHIAFYGVICIVIDFPFCLLKGRIMRTKVAYTTGKQKSSEVTGA